MDHHDATLIEFCGKYNCWGTYFESQYRDNEISYATGSLILDNQIRPETLFRQAIQPG
ncbi:29809_t:CDS:2 [Racocetra persica]|uniref:29809_t:CDS:1 n=1 Tax=Racocetra persica TaxID=160502 RepID=A0ACA9LQV0_9GLOM|nr:29809_t:CDS:2 [Racocetra persica]